MQNIVLRVVILSLLGLEFPYIASVYPLNAAATTCFTPVAPKLVAKLMAKPAVATYIKGHVYLVASGSLTSEGVMELKSNSDVAAVAEILHTSDKERLSFACLYGALATQ